jgi:hypothetical protein
VDKRVPYLTYAKYAYGNKSTSSLSEFKGRHGFEQMCVPRYYVPLTVKGRMANQLRLYRGIEGFLPERVLASLLAMRARVYRLLLPGPDRGTRPESSCLLLDEEKVGPILSR